MIVRIFTNYKVPDISVLLGCDVDILERQGVKVRINRSGPADLVLVLNTATVPRWVFAKNEAILKLVQEPSVPGAWSHAFTYMHSRVYHEILTHSPSPGDPRQRKSLGYLPGLVSMHRTEDWDSNLKRFDLSIISSSLDVLPGHRLRLEFIERLLASKPELSTHTFGRGRAVGLNNKEDGLIPYRYSIAIENWASDSYITEKFTDCIRMGSVPIYYGAKDICDYFPERSYIWLPINDFERCLEILETLGPADYLERLPFIREALDLLETRYSLAVLIKSKVEVLKAQKGGGRRAIIFPRLDGLLGILYILAKSTGRFFPREVRGVITRRLFGD